MLDLVWNILALGLVVRMLSGQASLGRSTTWYVSLLITTGMLSAFGSIPSEVLALDGPRVTEELEVCSWS